jgi:putative hydrolase of the HAD superfamily
VTVSDRVPAATTGTDRQLAGQWKVVARDRSGEQAGAVAIKAVLLDSGGVLIGPKGGRWNPRSDFEENLAEHHPDLDAAAVAAAIVVGDAWMTAQPSTPNYLDYYRVILGELAIDATDELLASLMRDREVTYFIEVFPEVLDVIAELRRRDIRLAVVSDAWPSLPEMHVAVGLGGCFEVYAISAVLGCNKPDPRMYRHASDGLGLEPHECLFVDDVPELVAVAIALGYDAVMMRRNGEHVPEGIRAIESLTEVLDLLDR